MLTITEKRSGRCDLDGKDRDPVYVVSVHGESGEYVLCYHCLRKIADMKLQRAGKVVKPSEPVEP